MPTRNMDSRFIRLRHSKIRTPDQLQSLKFSNFYSDHTERKNVWPD